MIWVMSDFLQHPEMSFIISVRDSEAAQDERFVLSPIQKCIYASLLCLSGFWQDSRPVNFIQNLDLSQSRLELHILMHFLFWCTLFHLYSVSKKGRSIDMHWKCSYKAVKKFIFKTSIKYMLYAVSCKQHIVSYQRTVIYFQRKAQMRIALPTLSNRRGFINPHGPIMTVLSFVVFYFSFVLLCSEQRKSLVSLPVRVG